MKFQRESRAECGRDDGEVGGDLADLAAAGEAGLEHQGQEARTQVRLISQGLVRTCTGTKVLSLCGQRICLLNGRISVKIL